MLTESKTTTTTVIVRDYDTDGELRGETVTVDKPDHKTVTERTFDTDGMLRTETVTQTDTATTGYRFTSGQSFRLPGY